MKKFFLLITFMTTLFGCSDQLEFNPQTFHAEKDLLMWRASDFSANFNEDGSVNLVGSVNNEAVTLHISNSAPGTYPLGIDLTNNAFFRTTNDLLYTTLNDGDGEVVIEEYDVIEQTFTGTFKFNAYTAEGEKTTFVEGIFYRVSVVTETDRPDGELTATVDDVSLEAEAYTTTISEGIIEFNASALDGRYIYLQMPETIGIGSYNLNEQSATYTNAVYGFSDGVTSNSQFGTLFITQHDIALRTIQGSFSFETLLPNNVTVENGNFTIYY